MTRGFWVFLFLSIALCANGQEHATYYGINASQFVNSFISPNNVITPGQLNSFGVHFYFVDGNRATRIEIGASNLDELNSFTGGNEFAVLIDSRFGYGRERRIELSDRLLFSWGAGFRVGHRRQSDDENFEFVFSSGGNIFTGIQYNIADHLYLRSEAGIVGVLELQGNDFDDGSGFPLPQIDGFAAGAGMDLLNALILIVKF
ncbi:MAG: hypothetical protein ACI84C_000173 [Flavobacteriales bacterium]|jgi:hypothetical protein